MTAFLLAVALLVGFDAGSRDPRSEGAAAHDRPVVRVDQGGYLSTDPKTAFVMAGSDLAGARYEVVDKDGDVVRSGAPGASAGAWNRRWTSVRPIDLSAVRTPGHYTLRVTGAVPASFTVTRPDRLDERLLAKSVRFFQAQRDGRDVIGDVLDRHPSHVLDATATVYATPRYDEDGTLLDAHLRPVGEPVDVEGGWFDAGDFLKFTGTTAYAVTAMLVAARDTHVPGLGEETAHGLEWLDKMWDDDTQTLYAQVGIGNGNEQVRTDHDVWRLPEDDDARVVAPGDPDWTISHRPVFRANKPGQPIGPSLAGRTAAAFALAAQGADSPEAARVWLEKAATVYGLADTTAVANGTAVPEAFYPEDSWQDDLELAATELAIAARGLGDARADSWQAEASAWAAEYIKSDARGTLEVADVSALAHADLIDLGSANRAALITDLRRQLDGGLRTAKRDPFGVAVTLTDFDSVPHALGLVATARLYERVTGDPRYRGLAARQRGWVLGANPWGSTFIIGVGRVYPRCPEHQVDNLANAGDAVGGVVNGPNGAKLLDELNHFPTMKRCSANPGHPYAEFDGHGARYLDDVRAWQTVEPAIDFTANAVLAFGISHH